MRTSYSRAIGLILLASCIASTSTSAADILDGIGNVGDGGSAGTSTLKYPGMLNSLRGFNFGGPTFPYNHAHSGGSSTSILQPGGQIDQLTAQVSAGDVTLALITIGDNDLFPYVPDITAGAYTPSGLENYQNLLAANIITAVDRVLAAGGKVVLGGVSNVTNSPAAWPYVPTNVEKDRLEGAIAGVQQRLADYAMQNNIPFIDFYLLEKTVFDSGGFVVGGVNINLDTYGPDPHNFFQSEYNAGTVIRGQIANLWIQAINQGYGTSVPLLTDLEILTLAGLEDEYTGETFQAAVPLTGFVHTGVPEPSSAVLGGFGLVGLAACIARRRRRPRRKNGGATTVGQAHRA
jgi:MYXO-CTERM domain-containing protein